MFNLIALIVVAVVIYALYWLKEHVKDTNKTLIKQSSKLARQAAEAAKRGDFAERDRLDEARAAVLTAIAGTKVEAKGSDHDDFTQRYIE